MICRVRGLLPLFLVVSVVAPFFLLAPDVVTFLSGSLTLHGVIYKPEGNGPFPAVLYIYNHGSAPGMLSEEAFDALGPVFAKNGWVFFGPYRRGQGLSAAAGKYIGEEIAAATKAGGLRSGAATMVRLLETDLVVATHGRSFWALDDISPLRQAAASIAAEDAHLFTPRTAWRARMGHFNPRRHPVGENPPNGAIVYYYLKAEPKEPAKLEILDAQGKVIRAFTSEEKKKEEAPEEWEHDAPEERIPAKAGLNLFTWDLRYEDPPKIPQVVYDAGDPIGPLALPGTYQVRLTVGGQSQTASFEIKMDPRVKTSAEDLREQFDLILRIRDRTDEMNKAIVAIRDLRGQLQALEKRLGPGQAAKNDASDPPNPVVTASADLRKKIGAIEEELIQVNGKSTEDFANYPTRLESKLAYLQNVTDGADTAPTAAEEAVFPELDQRLETQLSKWRDVLAKDVVALNEAMRKNNVALIAPAASTAK